MQRAQAKMLREYFSGVPVESLSKRYGYSIVKIKTLATEYKKGKIDIFDNPQKRRIVYRPEKSLPKKVKKNGSKKLPGDAARTRSIIPYARASSEVIQ